MYIDIVMSILIGYLLGSIPFALIIGKLFYKTDIRHYGSKNLGGGNAGRVLGKTAGLSVMTMDILKVVFAIFLAKICFGEEIIMVLAGISAAIGHCFPVFANFKGGKAVATMYGFLFGMMVVAGYTPVIFFLPLISFLIVLYITKIIAVSSIASAIVVTIYVFFTIESWSIFAALVILTLIIIWRHRSNIKRIIKKEETKVKWI